MSSFNDLRNKFVLGLLSSSAIGIGLWFVPSDICKKLGINLAVFSMGGLVATQLVVDESEKLVIKSQDKDNKTLRIVNDFLASSIEVSDKLDTELTCKIVEYETKISKLNQAVAGYQELNDNLQLQLKSVSTQIENGNLESQKLTQEFSEKLADALEVDASVAEDYLSESLNQFKVEIQGLIKATRFHYPNLIDKMNEIETKVFDKITEFANQINYIGTLESCKDLIESSIAIQHQIIYHLGAIKASIFTSQIRQLKLELQDSVHLDEHNKIVDSINLTWTNKYNLLVGNLESLRQEFSETANNVIQAYNTDWKDMVGQGLEGEELISQLKLEIINLQNQISELKKPLLFVGGSNKSDNGNRVINHYYKKGICLDSFDWEETETGYKLFFYVGRNGGKFINEELLNEDSNGEKIRDLCECLNIPQFKRSTRGGHFSLEVQMTQAKKKNDRDDIDKIWIPASKFESYVKKWERVRITAGSTGGKSPTAKNLALAIMNSRKGKGEIKLYDPQDGSKKDFWNMPKSGTSHEDSVAGMKEVCDLIENRKQGENHPFILYLFDEVDNTCTRNKEGVKFKDLIKVTLKESSHANIGIIYIGQSADANEVPGMTHSNWGNAVALHIGSNAGIAIDSLKVITSDDKSKLLDQYRKIQEYCDRKNEELGLDIYSDRGAYRFALVVPLTGLPKFIQLPDFDSYEYSEVMQEYQEYQELSLPVLALTTKCPHCGSEKVKRNGRRKDGTQYYSCIDCTNSPRKWVKSDIS